MRFDRALHVTTRLVALSALLALLLTREASAWLVAPATAMAAAGIFIPRVAAGALPKGAAALLALLASGFSVADFFYISGSLILAGAHLLVILLVIKLLSLERDRDYVQAYAASFFLLLAATGLSTEVYFLAVFIMFFVSLAWSLILLTIRKEAAEAGRGVAGLRVGRYFLGGTAALMLASTFFTLVIFLVIPRVGMGYFSRRAGGLLRVSGFSDRVDLGSMGKVLQDPTAVMRVEFPEIKGRPQGPLYFRGRAFDRFDGRTWESGAGGRVVLFRSPDGTIYLPGGVAPEGRITQNISLEPMEDAAIFALYPPVSLTTDLRSILVDPTLSLYLPYPTGGRVNYTVLSGAAPPGGGLSEAGADAAPEDGYRYLQTPGGQGAVPELAARVAGGEKDAYKKAVLIRDYLMKGYAYTLDPPRDSRYAPVEDFLFHARAGYCEHFATAMALMLRSAGVPSRMVSGFLDGEWNEYGHYFVVREQDAHTWVEAWVPGRGWVAFDPTPPSPKRAAGLLGSVVKMADFIKYKWNRYIVFYSLRDQTGAVRELAGAFRRAEDGLGRAGDAGLRWGGLAGYKARGVPAAAALIALLALGLLLYRIARRPRGRAGRYPAIPYYVEMVKLLGKRGFTRPPGVTPMEFARTLAAKGGTLGAALYITEIYNRERFGERPPDESEQGRIKELLNSLTTR